MVTFHAADVAVILLFMIAAVTVGLLAQRNIKKHDSEGYLLAGRALTMPAFVATLVATWYGGILGVGEWSYGYGLSNWTVMGMPYYIFAIIYAIWLAPKVRDGGSVTIPDQLRKTFGERCGMIGAVLTFILVNPAPYVLITGVLFKLVFGWPMLPCLVVSALLSVVTIFKGGFLSDVRVNILQFIFMFAGFFVILPFAFHGHGGLMYLRTHLPALHLTWLGGNSVSYALVWFFIAMQTLVDPGFHQRCAAAKSPKVAQQGILVSVLFWILFDFMTTSAGLYSRAILGHIDQPMYAYPLLAQKILPAGAKGAFFVGMFATVMSTVVSYTFMASVTFGRDLVWRARKQSNEQTAQTYTKWSIAVVSALAILLSWKVQSVINLWYLLGSVCIPGLLIPLMGSYWLKGQADHRWVAASMIAGSATAVVWLAWGVSMGSLEMPAYWKDIQPMYPGLAASAVCYAIGQAVYKAQSADQQAELKQTA